MGRRTATLGSRRYLGCKQALVGFIRASVEEAWGSPGSVLDVFAGTGVVGAAFNQPDRPVMALDLLEANRVCLNTFLGAEPVSRRRLAQAVGLMNGLAGEEGYVHRTFGGLFFGVEPSARIDAVRDWIEAEGFTGRFRDCLVASVLLGADRVARTCGHYDAYRATGPDSPELEFPVPELPSRGTNWGNRVIRGRAEEQVENLECDLAYLDPPYNSRQYADLYHLLENLARWEKPAVTGKARKMDRTGLKSGFNRKDAPEVMRRVVRGLRCNRIAVSYSNMGGKGDPRSQARISDEELRDILAERGPVTEVETGYRPFTAGKSAIRDHRERLFLCRVER